MSEENKETKRILWKTLIEKTEKANSLKEIKAGQRTERKTKREYFWSENEGADGMVSSKCYKEMNIVKTKQNTAVYIFFSWSIL